MVGRRLCCALSSRKTPIDDLQQDAHNGVGRKQRSKRGLFGFPKKALYGVDNEQSAEAYNLGLVQPDSSMKLEVPFAATSTNDDKLQDSFQGPPSPTAHAKCAMGEYCMAFESPPGASLHWVWCNACPKESRAYHEACWKMGHHIVRCHTCEPWFVEEPNAESFNFGRTKLNVASDAFGTVYAYDAVTTGYDAYEEWAKGAISFQEFVVQSGEACARSLGAASGALGGAAGGAAVGTLVLPGVGTAVGTVVGSFFCGLTGGWLAGILTGNALDWLYVDETELHIDTVLLALKTLKLSTYDPFDLPLAVTERQWRLLAREMHPDKCRRRQNENEEEYNTRRAECTEEMQKLGHHYRTLVAFIRNRDRSNWQRIKDRLVEKWTSSGTTQAIENQLVDPA